MSIQLEQKVKILRREMAELRELIDALRDDIVDIQAGGSLTSEPGLNIPKFPRVLEQLGLTPPEKQGEAEPLEDTA